MSIRLRLTAWYVLTLAVALGAVGLALVLAFRGAMERQLGQPAPRHPRACAPARRGDRGGRWLRPGVSRAPSGRAPPPRGRGLRREGSLTPARAAGAARRRARQARPHARRDARSRRGR